MICCLTSIKVPEKRSCGLYWVVSIAKLSSTYVREPATPGRMRNASLVRSIARALPVPVLGTVAIVFAVLFVQPQTAPIVRLAQGSIKGTTNHEGHDLEAFLGIRYAHSPTGEQRWRKALPVWEQDVNPFDSLSITANRTDPAENLFDASYFGPSCLQFTPPRFMTYQSPDMMNRNQALVDEDCLSINIFRSKGSTQAGSLLPVLFWIPGGAFLMGDSFAFHPSEILKTSEAAGTPIIFVSINYRLGAMGFLAGPALASEHLAGRADLNVALHDQRTALRWVQRHISAFGGDPRRVTIAGESAGGISVAYQMLADGPGGKEEDKDLYAQAIMQSGGTSASVVPPTANRHAQHYKTFLSSTLCPRNPRNDTAQLACLRKASAKHLQAANVRTLSYVLQVESMRSYSTPAYFPFWPVLDGELLRDSPLKLWDDGSYKDIPFISGSTLDEGTRFTPHDVYDEAALRGLLDKTLIADDKIAQGPTRSQILERVLTAYPDVPAHGSPYNPQVSGKEPHDRLLPGPRVPKGSTDAPLPNTNQFKRIASALGDIFFQYPRRASLQAHARHALSGVHRSKAWSYLVTQTKPGAKPWHGVSHGACLDYVFGKALPEFIFFRPPQNFLIKGNRWDGLSVETRRRWVAFVATGDPNVKQLDTWPPYTAAKPWLLQLEAHNTTLISDTFRRESMAIFDDPEMRVALAF